MKIQQQEIEVLRRARKGDGEFVLLEGYHAIKHAMRFDADIKQIYVDTDHLRSFTDSLEDSVADAHVLDVIATTSQMLSHADFENLVRHLQPAGHGVRTGMIAMALKPSVDIESLASSAQTIVYLENPRDLDNIGAVVRVCAARGTTSIITTGESNPWHAHALRASAGLHFALSIIRAHSEASLTVDDIAQFSGNRSVFLCTDEGESVYDADLPRGSALIFGTEREGVTAALRTSALPKISLPMQSGVSSMNLATSVSAILFSHRNM